MRLKDRLAGSRVLVTGVTGFVGEALLYRILTELPDTHVTVLVRPKGSARGQDRLAEMVAKPIFAAARDAAGGAAALLESRVRVLEGDLADVPELPADLDVVVHCAGDVSFDPPIQDAFTVNVHGTENLLRRVAALPTGVRYVHVSTAYVAGRRRGAVPEHAVDHDVDRHAEARFAAALGDRIEEESRKPDLLAKLRAKAEREHLRAGFLTAATDTERRRTDWVKEQLVKAGSERARSLGWTDVYTFTKAMGERVVEEYAPSVPCSIVRPSIIESALRIPYPGWIEGFKMAEPLIMSFGRGELPEFPAAPDSVVDIVPVDKVAGAIIAVMATTPPAGEARYYHISSGARNPLNFQNLYEIVRGYFERHPFDVGDRGAVRLPSWRLPGGERVERLLVTSERANKVADYLVTHVPRGERTRELARRIDRHQRRLDFLRRYIELYREYARAELRFIDDATLALHEDLDDADLDRLGFDTADYDWGYYLGEVHCPAVTAPVRRLDVARRMRDRVGPRPPRPLTESAKVLAAFDMDGTLLSSNVIETYLWMRLPDLDPASRFGEVAKLLGRLPGYVGSERRDRGSFLRSVYRQYAGADLAELEALADDVLATHVLERLSSQALRKVREHRAAGHHTVLVTGAIRPLTRPLRPLFDTIVAADLATDARGRCTGHLEASPMVGEARASWLRHYASQHGFDLASSYAYADSHSDLPLLRAVGIPVAVSPDVPLQRAAKKNKWQIVGWADTSAAPRVLLPEGRPQ
jgi:HAD superfamily hydrolase (TIGR01490 family)